MTVENTWAQILSKALDGAVVEQPAATRPDFVIRTRDGRSIVVDVKWAGEGWPQDVRRAAADLVDDWPEHVVLLARHLSPGAIDWLRARGANWADDAGQARILGPDGLIVIREPRRVPHDNRPRPVKWSPSQISIAEALLATPDRDLRAADVASRSRWSIAQTAAVLATFDAQGWTVKRGAARGPKAHRRLADSDALLASWSSAVAETSRTTRTAHRATRDVMELLYDQLAPALDRGTRWAISGWAGLELAAPFATTTPSLHVYVSNRDFAGPLSGAIEEAGLREVDEGGRVTFWATDRRVLELASRQRDIPVVSPPRLYADLDAFGARGIDAASHVKDELIDPLHTPESAEVEADG